MTTPMTTYEEARANELKLCLFGGRDFTDLHRMKKHVVMIIEALAKEGRTLAIVSGMARGADHTGFKIAEQLNLHIYEFPADWEGLGKGAGFIRNKQMAEFCDEAMGYWDQKSRGTSHMIEQMKRQGKPVAVHTY